VRVAPAGGARLGRSGRSAAADGRLSFSGALPLVGAGVVAGAALAMLLKKEKRVYGKGLTQFLPSDASALAKNIA